MSEDSENLKKALVEVLKKEAGKLDFMEIREVLLELAMEILLGVLRGSHEEK